MNNLWFMFMVIFLNLFLFNQIINNNIIKILLINIFLLCNLIKTDL